VTTAAIRVIAEDIKIAHSIFALPFAVLGAFMAAAGSIIWSAFIGQLLLIVVAMVFARTAAMLANRILDHKFDSRNPRTDRRAIPSGRLSLTTAKSALAISAIGFFVVCALFGILYGNWWPAILGVPVLVWICAYALFKRFTWFCHLWLGASLGLSPVAAAIAVNPASLEAPAIWLLAAMVVCWVAGFDIIYALQDIDIDRRDGLLSVPARFGSDGALLISRILHCAAVVFLALTWKTEPAFGALFLGTVIVVAILLIIEHATVRSWGTTRMALTFMTLNGMVSLVVGLAGIVDLMGGAA
jgi:4-hydroxybenzoate polyprenyltransferase